MRGIVDGYDRGKYTSVQLLIYVNTVLLNLKKMKKNVLTQSLKTIERLVHQKANQDLWLKIKITKWPKCHSQRNLE